MAVKSNKRIILKAYPKGMPKIDEDFELVHQSIDIENLNLKENEFIVRNLYLSIDPYVRETLKEPGPMEAVSVAEKPVSLGQVVAGVGVSEVIKTNNPNFKVGDLVFGIIAWEEYTHVKTETAPLFSLVNKELLKDIPLSYHVALLRFGGLTPYASLFVIGKPKKGETIYISAAAGFTGQLVGQMAKIKGLKVVGSAGSDEKVDFLLNELKFDAAFNYKKVDHDKALSEYCPNGIDIYYENVGGKTLDVALEHCNQFARIVVCGMISQYNITNPEERYGVKNLMNIFFKSILMQGFIVTEYLGTSIEKDFERDIVEWIKTGKIIYKEKIIEGGVEKIPQAFVDMLGGKNIGKTMVKIGDY